MHQRPGHRQSPGALGAGDRAGGVQRGRGGGHLHQGAVGAEASAGRLLSGMERAVFSALWSMWHILRQKEIGTCNDSIFSLLYMRTYWRNT